MISPAIAKNTNKQQPLIPCKKGTGKEERPPLEYQSVAKKD